MFPNLHCFADITKVKRLGRFEPEVGPFPAAETAGVDRTILGIGRSPTSKDALLKCPNHERIRRAPRRLPGDFLCGTNAFVRAARIDSH